MTQIETLKLALEALESNRRTHYYCEDTWYSCPKHEDGCANDSEGDECNCGADKANAGIDQAITAIKAALEAKDEPVAWIDERAIAWLAEHPHGNITTKLELQKSFERPMPLYTTTPQRKPLTDEEIGEVAIKSQDGISPHDDTLRFARAIEAAHGIKGEV